jgi:hypothetical protein
MPALFAALALTIRVYDIYGLPPAQRQEAMAVAVATLQEAGVQAAIVDCSPRRPPALCLTPPASGEIVLRFGRHPRDGRHVLGEAVVHPDPEQCTLATVYAAAVAERARGLGVPVGTLVGRVAAHEIGHLLLGSSSHAGDGLMRGAWDVRRRQAGDWRFSRQDAAAIRLRLAQRDEAIALLAARR